MNNAALTQQEQLENLKTYYGNSLYWAEVTIPITYNEMLEIWGEKCDSYEHECSLCRAWEQWQTQNNKVTVIIPRSEVIKAAKGE
jgi:hypothetical protein